MTVLSEFFDIDVVVIFVPSIDADVDIDVAQLDGDD